MLGSVAVRDALRTLLDDSSTYLDEQDPDLGLSNVYREAALRRGFPIEMRQRWSERSVTMALQLDGLDDDTRDALLAIESENSLEFAALRNDAIIKCIARDPKLSRDFIDAEFDRNGKQMDWNPELWLGINYEAFSFIDDRTESQLRVILTTEQFETLALLKRAEGRAVGKGREGRKR